MIFCAYNPLIYASCQKTGKCSPMQLRQLEFISQFPTNVQHVSGKQNTVSDAFSRMEGIELPINIDYNLTEQEQQRDESLRSLQPDSSGLDLKPFALSSDGPDLHCNASIGVIRPLVPECLRKTVLGSIHSLLHPNGRATAMLAKSKFI